MTAIKIELENASALERQSWFAPLVERSIPLCEREISLDDARRVDQVLSQTKEVGRNLYGFNPIPARGVIVTNELVNKLRGELGI